MKTAVVLFVRNEVHDVADWIAWQHVIGFDTIVVYDDHSEDGTREVAMAASRHVDVRVHATDLSAGADQEHSFMFRQNDAYNDALRRYGGEFDWLAFFDCDEYLFLPDFSRVGTFVSRPEFADADAIAVNWCIYGSNELLMRPNLSVVEAFTMHDKDVGNDPAFVGVKSIVRPGRVAPHWHHPHAVSPLNDRYVDTHGRPVPFPVVGNVPVEHVSWTRAKLMHFVVKSHEHYIAKVRRRSDLLVLSNDKLREQFDYYDRNFVQDLRPLAHVPAMGALSALIRAHS